jgi:hypothetical protein
MDDKREQSSMNQCHPVVPAVASSDQLAVTKGALEQNDLCNTPIGHTKYHATCGYERSDFAEDMRA